MKAFLLFCNTTLPQRYQPETAQKDETYRSKCRRTPRQGAKPFLILEHTKSYIEKIHSTDAELAGHEHKLDVKLQSLCGSGFSLFAVRIPAKPHHLGVN